MRRLTRLRARGWKGQTFEEDLPERLILTGPNGSGKTSRMEAISFALSTPAGKDGLAPYMSSDHTEISIGTDAEMVTRSCSRSEKSGTVKFKLEHRFEPSMGEKSKKDVDARVTDSFQIEPFVLDLDGWFAASAPERRRQFLALLGSASIEVAERVIADLKEDVGLIGNTEWDQLIGSIPPSDPDDRSALEWLQMVEAMSKARLSAIVERKKALVSKLRTDEPDSEPVRNADEVEAMIETLDTAIEKAEADSAVLTDRIETRQRHVRAIAISKTKLPAKFVDTEHRRERLQAQIEKVDGLRIEGERVAKESANTLDGAFVNQKRATRHATDKIARLDVLKALQDKWVRSDDSECPFCGTMVDELGPMVRSRIGLLESVVSSARADQSKADQGAVDARLASKKASKSLVAWTESHNGLTHGLEALGELEEAEQALKLFDESAPAATDKDVLGGLRAERAALQEEIRVSAQAEERRRASEAALDEARQLDEQDAQVRSILRIVGVSGAQGRLLGEMLSPIQAVLATFESNGRSYSLRTQDERGNPDAMLTLGGAPYQSMSGGERAIGMAALAAAVSRIDPNRTACLLIEAGEIDAGNLAVLTKALKRVEASNAVIATHLEVREGDKAAEGWTVRTLRKTD